MLKPHRFWSAAVLACTLLVATACAGAAEQAQGKAGASKGAESEVAATIGSESISLQQVDEKARAISLQPYQALYDARRGALDQLRIESKCREHRAGIRGERGREWTALGANSCAGGARGSTHSH